MRACANAAWTSSRRVAVSQTWLQANELDRATGAPTPATTSPAASAPMMGSRQRLIALRRARIRHTHHVSESPSSCGLSAIASAPPQRHCPGYASPSEVIQLGWTPASYASVTNASPWDHRTVGSCPSPSTAQAHECAAGSHLVGDRLCRGVVVADEFIWRAAIIGAVVEINPYDIVEFNCCRPEIQDYVVRIPS